MRIGYSVEGSTDRALVRGFRDRWCPTSELVEGKFRGQTQTSRRREIPKICFELSEKQVDLIVFLTDSNDNSWRDVQRADREKCPPEFGYLSVFGVCLRNAECWLASDAGYIAACLSQSESEFRKEDPKGIVESAFGVTGNDKKEAEIANFVRNAPLHNWLCNPSFEDFYDQLRNQSKRRGCDIENLRDSRQGAA